MRIDLITLFPQLFDGFFSESIIKRAKSQGSIDVYLHQLRDFAEGKQKMVDDYPFGGGEGMVLKPDPFFKAVASIPRKSKTRVILMCPQGELFTQDKAVEFSKEEQLIFLCGHYEGFDERIREHLVTDEISIGDYVLTGGEIPAMVVMDSVIRLLPNVLGNEQSHEKDSFSNGLLEYPQYTRPSSYLDYDVPEILLSGNHQQIAEWREKESLRKTWMRRKDLLEKLHLNDKQLQWIKEFEKPIK